MRIMESKKPFVAKLLMVLGGFFSIACFSQSTRAYVLPGPQILELMTAQSRPAKTLLVSQKLLVHEDSTQPAPIELNETLKYAFPDSFRSDIESENTQRIHVASKGAAVTVIDGRISPRPETLFDRYKDLILYHSRELLNAQLTLLGVDVTLTSVGRFEGQIAYVLGAQYPDESNSQIWFDRNTFRPFRWLLVAGPEGAVRNVLDVRYADWREVRGMWYPMHIEFYQDQRLVREIRVTHLKVNPSFSGGIFDIEHLRSIYRPMPEIVPETKAAEGIPEIQKTIEDFKKMYE